MTELPSIEEYENRAKALSLSGECFINGRYVPARSGATYDNHSPIDGRLLNRVSAAQPEDVDDAVSSALTAFNDGRWSDTAPAHKKKVLFRWADIVASRAEELALLETLDAGKPVRYSGKIDIGHCLSTIRYYAEALDKIYGQVANTNAHSLATVTREPLGVVGAITPWNFPMMMACWKVVPALAMGNSVVLKPAEQTPLTALKLAEWAVEAGLPDGVFNVIPGDGEVAGKRLALHRNVDAISFTGSTEVAKKLLTYSGESNMKRVSAETGGKSPNIIFEDAYDLEFAAKQAAFSIFFNTGAMCVAGSRLLVQEGAVEEVTHWLREITANKLKVGHPMDASTVIGPVIDGQQFQKIMSYVQHGKREGAHLLFGGRREEPVEGGFYIQPAIFDQVNASMTIARDEIFGPVVCVIPFKDEADAIRIANDTLYGLNAGLWTSDLGKAHRVARKVKAGTVWVNNWEGSDYTTPFGGFKQSGFGGKDKSMHALDKYSNLKTTWIHIDGKGARPPQKQS